jgi:hypothetical protein
MIERLYDDRIDRITLRNDLVRPCIGKDRCISTRHVKENDMSSTPRF